MKRIFIIFFYFCFFANVFSQTLSVTSIVELSNDITARTKERVDEKGVPCALLRINSPLMTMSFSDNVVGEVDVMPGEYCVYVPDGTKSFQIKRNNQLINVEFSNFGINVVGKKCYRIILADSEKTEVAVNVGTLNISANYDNVFVLVDGVPMGQLPIKIENIAPGEHVIAIPNTLGVTMKDLAVNVAAGQEKKLYLKLYEEDRTPVKVECSPNYDGGDLPSSYNFVLGINVVDKNGKKGVVDYTGKVLVPFEFEDINPAKQNGFYRVTQYVQNGAYLYKDDKHLGFGLYKPSVGLVNDCIYDCVFDESERMSKYMPARLNGRWGVLDPTGKVIIPFLYEADSYTHPMCYENVIVIPFLKGKKNYDDVYKYGLFNLQGKMVAPDHYDYLGHFKEGVGTFEINKQIGIINEVGEVLAMLPNNLYISDCASSGLFRVTDINTEKKGFINTKGEVVIPAKFDVADDFKNGICRVEQNNETKIIDTRGNVVAETSLNGYQSLEVLCEVLDEAIYAVIENTNRSYIRVEDHSHISGESGGYKGLLSSNGHCLVPCEKSEIRIFRDNDHDYILTMTHDSIGSVYDENGNLIVEEKGITFDWVKDGFIHFSKTIENAPESDIYSFGYLNTKGRLLIGGICGKNIDTSSSVDNNVDDDKEDMLAIEDFITCKQLGYGCPTPVSDGLAIIYLGDRYGIINDNGDVVVPLVYTAITPFENGEAFARDKNGTWSKIYSNQLKTR